MHTIRLKILSKLDYIFEAKIKNWFNGLFGEQVKKKLLIIMAGVTLLAVVGFLISLTDGGKITKTNTVSDNSVNQAQKPIDSSEQNNLNDSAAPGSYVSLADYNADPVKYAKSKKIYFFHASWCPVCQAIDKEINVDLSKIPSGVTVIKTDFDDSTELRKKYGVTYQYTFVQVDSEGNEVAQWTASSLDDVIAGIKS